MNITNVPYERSVSTEIAFKRIQIFLDRAKISFELESFGKTVKTFLCTLKDDQGEVLSQGSGKGFEAARLGAICEAIEHLYTHAALMESEFSLHSVESILQQNAIQRDRVAEIMREDKQQYSHKILCRSYETVDQKQQLNYPLGPTCPAYDFVDDYEHKYIEKYSTNSGTALGINLEEALLHAVLERIERDVFSRFLLEAFVLNKNLSFPRTIAELIDRKSLPLSLREHHKKIEDEINQKVELLSLKNPWGVFVYVAFLKEPRAFIVQPIGCGASLSPTYAAQRALTELVQYIQLEDEYSRDEDIANHHALQSYPRLLQAFEFNIHTLLKDVRYHPFKQMDQALETFPPHDQLSYIIDKLHHQNVEVFYVKNIETPEMVVVNAIIPGFEYFNIIRNGKLVSPSSHLLNQYACDKAV